MKVMKFKLKFDKEKCKKPVELISKAWKKIPLDVQQKLSEKTIAIMTGYGEYVANGYTFKSKELIEDNFIHLEPYIWDNYNEDKIIEIIHEELAHIYLEHSILNEKKYEKQEKQAKDLVKAWK